MRDLATRFFNIKGAAISMAALTLLFFTNIAVAQKSLSGSLPVAELPDNADEFEEEETCLSAREFITTMEFLKDKGDDLGIDQDKARKLAESISAGCTGAAQRFITTLNLLMKLELGARDSLKYARAIAHKTDQHARVFQVVIKKSFLKNYLDLDIKTSMSYAKTLTFKYEGDVENAGKDFEELIKFCLSSKEMGLALNECGAIAVRMTVYGQGWTKGIREAFKRQYKFLRDDLGVSIQEALEISDFILKVSPYAVENFIEAYKYASSDGGLALPAKDALVLAKKIARRTLPRPQKSEVKKSKLN